MLDHPNSKRWRQPFNTKAIKTIVSKILVSAILGLTVTNALTDSSLGDLDLFKIVWKGPPTSDEKMLTGDNVINISTNNNERYMCIVPDNSDRLHFDTSARNSSTSEQTKTPIQILGPLLTGDVCSHKFELFWVYELCHGRYLRQYHEENVKYKAKVTQEYYLGRMDSGQIAAHEEEYEKEATDLRASGLSRPTIFVNGHYKPYLRFNMTGGTKCDLTKRNRVSRIIYVCNDEPSLELYSIKEISTCEYEAVVLTHLLCQHKDFKIDTNTQHEIKCYSLDGSPKMPKKTLDADDESNSLSEDEDAEDGSKGANNKRRSIAYFQGRTLIIDADLLLS